MSEPAPPTPPARTSGSGSGWLGCLLWPLAFVIVTLGGCMVGLALKGSPEDPVTGGGERFDIDEIDGYRLRGYIEDDQPCVELVRGGEQVAGQCDVGLERFTVTTWELSGGDTLVFAPVPEEAAEVELPTEGGPTRVPVREREGVRWFHHVGEPLVDDEPAVLLDRSGAEVTISTTTEPGG